ncbi:MAG TPA: Gfo/Idh/MocA family oxidoreductase [Ardenticatenaceae bacterium]|nr:Gfo/Idh/MocA family oxidoreductase [Ardenticatenaceae bacterium]
MAQVGCGARAQAHIAAMLDSGAVDVVALCDVDAERLHAAGEKFGITCRYHDLAEMVQAEQPELVDIVTPPTIRVEIVEAAVAAGAPAILIEKPLALTPSEAHHLVELGREHLVAVNTQYRWMPHWQRFWTVLGNRELGEVRLLRASTRTNLLEQGPHILDLVQNAAALCGLPDPEWLLAACDGKEYFGQLAVPADTSATIGLGAARLHFNAGPSAPEVPGETVYWYQQQIEVIGDRGRLWVSLNQGWRLWRAGHFEEGETAWPANDGEAQRALFVELRDSLHAGPDAWREFPTRVEVAGRNSDVLFGCYASALGEGRVTLEGPWSETLIEKIEGFITSAG